MASLVTLGQANYKQKCDIFRTILLIILTMIKFTNRNCDNIYDETCTLHKF